MNSVTLEWVNAMLDRLAEARKEQFGQSEAIYKALGKAMGALFDVRDELKSRAVSAE